MQSEESVINVKFTVVWTCSTHAWHAGSVAGGVVGVAPHGKDLKPVYNSQGKGCPWNSFEWKVEGPRTAGFIQAVPVVGRILGRAPIIGLYGGGCAVGWSGFDETWLSNFRKYTDEATSTTHWVEAPVSRYIMYNKAADPPVAFLQSDTNRYTW